MTVMRWAGITGPAVMGILNITPDSFSDGGNRLDPEAAIAAGLQMVEDGAAILDVGGESTRPGALPVSPEEEQSRILPVISALARAGATISIDTRNASTMERALDAGAAIVNDVSALSYDPAAQALVARRTCPVILMHMRGTPATMADHADYTDVATEVTTELHQRIEAAVAAGVDPGLIAIDPGFGFAKTAEQDIDLLCNLARLHALTRPIIVGLSRKRTIGVLTGERRIRHRGAGSIAAALAAVARGAAIIRVHDVAETCQALAVWRAVGTSEE